MKFDAYNLGLDQPTEALITTYTEELIYLKINRARRRLCDTTDDNVKSI